MKTVKKKAKKKEKVVTIEMFLAQILGGRPKDYKGVTIKIVGNNK